MIRYRHNAGALVLALLATLATRAAAQQAADADARFMSGMILHHAQAIVMAGWAPSHGASASVQEFCKKVVVSQRDEINLMSRWLTAHHQPIPDTAQARGMTMPGMAQPTLMPGMLTAAQLARLDSARGPEFDRRFLEDMIQHHQGALTMVQQLDDVPGGPKDQLVFQYSSDVSADQTVEIATMRRMLAAIPAAKP